MIIPSIEIIGGDNNGIYFNQLNGLLYVANTVKQRIDILDKNTLLIVKSINVSFQPWFIAEYNDMIAVSDKSGNINFFKN